MIEDLRKKIDALDKEIIELFLQRMETTNKVGAYKRENNIQTLDSSREKSIMEKIQAQAPEKMDLALVSLYQEIFKISKYYQDLEGQTFGLVGHPLGQSLSPLIHKNFAYDYELFDLDENSFEKFMEEKAFKGINVTIPYKIKVMDYLDWVSPLAERIGSVNTVVNRDGRLYGYNTDYQGLAYIIERAQIDLKDRLVLILGTGGAARTAHTLAEDLGTKDIRHISRSGPFSYDNIEKSKDYEVIINATPVGMYPHNGQVPLDLKIFPRLEGLVDLIYNPLRTQLVLDAMDLGVKTAPGLAMLVSQAFYASQHFTGYDLPDYLRQSILLNLEKSKENICLIGMPGSGKTSLAREVARLSGRAFADTDLEIEKIKGMTCQDIIEKKGIQAFRLIEKEVIGKISKCQGMVIATGGGSILDRENLDRLRSSSQLVYIKRDLARLSHEGRPLSQGPGAIERLYQERKNLYEKAGDFTVQVREGQLSETAKEILKGFEDENTSS